MSEDLWKCFLKRLIAQKYSMLLSFNCYYVHLKLIFYLIVSDWYLLGVKLSLSHTQIATF